MTATRHSKSFIMNEDLCAKYLFSLWSQCWRSFGQPMCSSESLDQLFDQETADKPRRDARFQSQNHKFCPGKLFHSGSRQCSGLKDPSHSCVQVKFSLIIAKLYHFLTIRSQKFQLLAARFCCCCIC